MSVDRKRLRELAMAATPGEWRTHSAGTSDEGIVRTVRDRSKMSHEVAITTTGDVTDEREAANTEFIAAANPQTILALLDALEAQDRPTTDDAMNARRYRWLQAHDMRLPDAALAHACHHALSDADVDRYIDAAIAEHRAAKRHGKERTP